MNRFRDVAWRLSSLAAHSLIFALLCSALAGASPQAPSEKHRGNPPGFLAERNLPDAVALIPPPPATGSAAFAADEEGYQAVRSVRNTPRWVLAASDAELAFPEAAGVFSCALGIPVTEKETPNLYSLMYRTKTDALRVNGKVKRHHGRTRPFVVYKESSCTPEWDGRMRKSGSYPSSHSTVGWTWALILAEIAPERSDTIFARGYAYGQSRVICGVHWQSDVTEGRTVAAALVARLHADPAFRAELEAAKAEIATARAKNLKPSRDCKAEAAALAFRPPKAP